MPAIGPDPAIVGIVRQSGKRWSRKGFCAHNERDIVLTYSQIPSFNFLAPFASRAFCDSAAGDALIGRGRAAGNRYSAILQAQFEHHRSAHREYCAPSRARSPMSFEHIEQFSLTEEE